MHSGLSSLITGIYASQLKLDVTANNIANANTTAFRKSRVNISEAPGAGVEAQVQVSNTQGAVIATGNNYDLAISGSGFFKIRLPDGQIGYTRDGLFRVDGNSRLVSQTGNPVSPDIVLPPGTVSFEVDNDGNAFATDSQGQRTPLGRIERAYFVNPSGLSAYGSGIYLETSASGQALAPAPGSSKIMQGFLEMSNTDLAEEAVSSIISAASIKADVAAIKTYDETLGTIIDILR